MAIDYGSRSIGVAVSDELGITVRPLTTIRITTRREKLSHQQVSERIHALTVEYEVGTLVVGLPLRADGTRGDAAERVERFISALQTQLSIPVVSCNEFLSSREADEILRAGGASLKERKSRSDEYAATVILRDYLVSQSPLPESPDTADFSDY